MIALTINGERREVDVPPDMPLLWVLRDVLGMTGTKFGCGMALCGACTVHLDGQAIRSCVTPVSAIGQSQDHDDRGDRRDAATARKCRRRGWIWKSSSAAIASRVRSCRRRRCSTPFRIPSDADIDAAMAGNICRCGTYCRIREAIKRAAAEA